MLRFKIPVKKRLLTAATLVLTTSMISILVASNTTYASITNTRVDDAGTVELTGASWLGGGGVDIYSNGNSAANEWGNNCVPKPGTAATTKCAIDTMWSGLMWQCVEMISRLYLAQGWIGARWQGNGNTLVNNVPTGLTTQLNGAISYLNAGDVITLDDGEYGHAAVVNSASGTSVGIVNQNTVAVYSSASISSGSLANSNATLSMSGWAGYAVQAVVHRPAAVTPPTTANADFVIYRASGGTGYWYAKSGPTGTAYIPWVNPALHGGWAQDVPLVGNFNGDSYDDFAIYRASGGTGYWYARNGVNTSEMIVNGSTHGGWAEDTPVTGDFDDDGKADLGIFRMVGGSTGTWYFKSSVNGAQTPIYGSIHGSPGDVPIVGDFDGDDIDDFGIYRAVNGTGSWYVKSGSNGQQISTAWGVTHGGWPGDVPVVGDFNADGYDDFGIYRPSAGTGYWYVKHGQNTSTMLVNGVTHGGWTQDKPLAGNFGS